jgi:hypothetical protein
MLNKGESVKKCYHALWPQWDVVAYMWMEAEHGKARGKSFTYFLCGLESASMASLAAHIRSRKTAVESR